MKPDLAAWDAADCAALIQTVEALRCELLALQERHAAELARLAPAHHASGVNLLHFLALHGQDRRALQDRLADLGLSSLGRCDSHVLAQLDKVLGLLHALAGLDWAPRRQDEPMGYHASRRQLARNAERLFGPAPAGRSVRIMVTLPSEAADDPALVERLVAQGLDIARINCAHDDAERWTRMAMQVRQAAQALGRPVRIHMDLGGPKLRTGPLPDGPAVLKLKPQRNARGQVLSPARVLLHPADAPAPHGSPLPAVGVDRDWWCRLAPGDVITLTDARGAHRRLKVAQGLRENPMGPAFSFAPHDDDGGADPAAPVSAWVVETRHTVYLEPASVLRQAAGTGPDARPQGILPRPGELRLQRDDRLHLLAAAPAGEPDTVGRSPAGVPTLTCTLPQALAAAQLGERVWFDDGRLGAVVERRLPQGLALRVTVARDGGEALRADKGINLPDTRLDLPALTPQDLADLPTVARLADTVGLSFAQWADDVRQLRAALADHGVPELGIVLKVETVRGFAHLPQLLLAALEGEAAGVMIARGDLAVECGYERLAEVQEEMLWACDAAHVPVIWATQVLDTLARTGQPTRAEITDAAMGERAECVMLNKGPHIKQAMQTLGTILGRMRDHQDKKRTLLRGLTAWSLAQESSADTAG